VLLRLGYLTLSNVFAVLRLLPMDDRAKDAEILALRHQIAVNSAGGGCGSAQRTGRCWRHCCTGYPKRRFGDSGCSYAPTRCCAGTAT
jgi:hypothetical protein